jgi:hypothetical protein
MSLSESDYTAKMYFECKICMETQLMYLQKQLSTCTHVFCKQCIKRWKRLDKYTCPYCRMPFINNPIQIKNKLLELMQRVRDGNKQIKLQSFDAVFDLLKISAAKVFIYHETFRPVVEQHLLDFERTRGTDCTYIRKWKHIFYT